MYKFLCKFRIYIKLLSFSLLSCDTYQTDNCERDKSYEDIGLHLLVIILSGGLN